jgi:formate dehydrogenase iron-sulfur subunit
MSIGEGATSPNQARHDHVATRTPTGFFTDPTVCIGCKACEVACKEWNGVPDDGYLFTGTSYDNTGSLGASSWRHVKFVEEETDDRFRWLFLSDVCKHCENAGCLEACPTGAIFRTEVESVYVQDDVCNGCGYCVVSCPFGVIDRRPKPLSGAGGAFKCTFCYDRQIEGLTPACAKACPTESIVFGPLEEVRKKARARVERLRSEGVSDARLYDPAETSVGGIHASFLLLGGPEKYGLPPRPVAPSEQLRVAWASAAATAAAMLLGILLAFAVL